MDTFRIEEQDIQLLQNLLEHDECLAPGRLRKLLEIAQALRNSSWEVQNASFSEIEAALKVDKAWRNNSTLRNLTPEQLKNAITIANNWENIPSINKKSFREIDRILNSSNRVSSDSLAENIDADMLRVVWKNRFGNATAYDVEQALEQKRAWRNTSRIEGKEIDELRKQLDLAKAWKDQSILKTTGVTEVQEACEIIKNEADIIRKINEEARWKVKDAYTEIKDDASLGKAIKTLADTYTGQSTFIEPHKYIGNLFAAEKALANFIADAGFSVTGVIMQGIGWAFDRDLTDPVKKMKKAKATIPGLWETGGLIWEGWKRAKEKNKKESEALKETK